MKKLIYLLVIFSFAGVYSCGNSGKEKQKASEEEVAGSTPCDEFLAEYEEWADEYYRAIEDYMNNPSDEEIADRYMELIQQAMEWSTKWITLADCADDEKYEKRFEEISREIEQKLKDLNL